jgi:hypothetical protein
MRSLAKAGATDRNVTCEKPANSPAHYNVQMVALRYVFALVLAVWG